MTPALAKGARLPRSAPGSHLFPDSGIAVLRAGGTAETRWHIPLTFSKGSYGHGHTDKLAINVIAGGYDLSADLGYPTTWTDAKYGGWETNTASHWTVMLDERAQTGNVTGKLGFYAETPCVDAVEASCEAAYPGCSLYRRSVALVRDRPGGEPLYAVDLFRVAGARVRDYLHHSLGKPEEAGIALSGPHGEWKAQARGTLAGEDVEFGAKPGLGFLKDVRRLAYDGAFTADWRVGGSSQPDRYLLTRESFGDCDIELTVTRTGKASGPRERAILVFHANAAEPGSHRQVWLDAGGTMLPVGKPVRVDVQVRGGKALVRVNGEAVERPTEVTGRPSEAGRVGFLHYYDYSLEYDDVVIREVGGGGREVRDTFEAPLAPERWERIDPTYRASAGHLVATDDDALALRLLVPGGVGAGAEVIEALGEGQGLRGRSPWERHVILRDRREDPSDVSTFASVLEMHRGAPKVESVSRLPLEPAVPGAVALRVAAAGRVDYILSSLDATRPWVARDGARRIEFEGRFGWVRTQSGKAAAGSLTGGGYLRCGEVRIGGRGPIRGRIVGTDVEGNRLRVKLTPPGALQKGDLLLVSEPGFLCPSVYPVSGAIRQRDGTWQVELGGVPLLVGWGKIASTEAAGGTFASATPVLKLRHNPGLFDGRRVRPAASNKAPESRVVSASEDAFRLGDAGGLRHFRRGGEFFVYDVGVGDAVEVVPTTWR